MPCHAHLKLRGERKQTHTHRPLNPLFRVTYPCESEHLEKDIRNVSNCFTKLEIVSAKIADVMFCDIDCKDIARSCRQWKMLTLG